MLKKGGNQMEEGKLPRSGFVHRLYICNYYEFRGLASKCEKFECFVYLGFHCINFLRIS